MIHQNGFTRMTVMMREFQESWSSSVERAKRHTSPNRRNGRGRGRRAGSRAGAGADTDEAIA